MLGLLLRWWWGAAGALRGGVLGVILLGILRVGREGAGAAFVTITLHCRRGTATAWNDGVPRIAIDTTEARLKLRVRMVLLLRVFLRMRAGVIGWCDGARSSGSGASARRWGNTAGLLLVVA